jgi:antibiotic biosynthesis monooxygenase (ABM) superfamily enzyme
MDNAMKHLNAFIRLLQVWFVSADKAFERKKAYTSLCVTVAALALLSFEFVPKTTLNNLLLLAMSLVASFLVILFITHFIIFKITQAQQRKDEKHDTKHAKKTDEDDL